MVWTLLSGVAAVTIGVGAGSAVLVAFGAVGFVDAAGSAALAVHFRHTVRHETFSERHERTAHRIVAFGLCVVGAAAIAGGAIRLASGAEADTSGAGVALAATAAVVLIALSRRKRTLAATVRSRALLGDSHLSAVGAGQAGATLLGSAVSWHAADPIAAMVVGAIALVIGVGSVRSVES